MLNVNPSVFYINFLYVNIGKKFIFQRKVLFYHNQSHSTDDNKVCFLYFPAYFTFAEILMLKKLREILSVWGQVWPIPSVVVVSTSLTSFFVISTSTSVTGLSTSIVSTGGIFRRWCRATDFQILYNENLSFIYCLRLLNFGLVLSFLEPIFNAQAGSGKKLNITRQFWQTRCQFYNRKIIQKKKWFLFENVIMIFLIFKILFIWLFSFLWII